MIDQSLRHSPAVTSLLVLTSLTIAAIVGKPLARAIWPNQGGGYHPENFALKAVVGLLAFFAGSWLVGRMRSIRSSSSGRHPPLS